MAELEFYDLSSGPYEFQVDEAYKEVEFKNHFPNFPDIKTFVREEIDTLKILSFERLDQLMMEGEIEELERQRLFSRGIIDEEIILKKALRGFVERIFSENCDLNANPQSADSFISYLNIIQIFTEELIENIVEELRMTYEVSPAKLFIVRNNLHFFMAALRENISRFLPKRFYH